MRRRTENLWFVLVLFSFPVTAEPKPFTFPTPEGFVSLEQTGTTPPGTAPPMSRIDDSFFSEAKSFDTYAVHLGPDGVDASYMAKVFAGTVPLSNLPEFAQKSLELSPLQDARVLSTRLVDIAGVRSGRIELETRIDGIEQRQLVYLLSGRVHWAVVKLVAQKSGYADASRRVEATLPRIQGLAAPTTTHVGGVVTAADEAQGKLGLWLLLGGLGGYLLNKLMRRQKLRRGT